VNGLADASDVQVVADQLTDGIAGARRLDLPDTGHMPSMERPVELTSALEDFLAGI
jgi:pimeloyl-ACP methyl ester carboxylesterase